LPNLHKTAAFVKVIPRNAEKMKKLLLRKGIMDKQRNVEHSGSYVLFPVVDIASERIIKLIKRGGGAITMRKGAVAERQDSYLGLLRKSLDANELNALVKGYDRLGNIVLIELPESLRGKKKTVARAVMSANKGVETVLEKVGAVRGVYRIRRLRYVAGKKNFVVNYVENGCRFVFDARKVFFSSRLSFERSRIASLVKDGERVIVMFAGVGPFVVEIAKRHAKSKVIGIELNRTAYMYMKQNIRLNKLGNAVAVFGDVKDVYKRYRDYADRIIMPLPMQSARFLKEAIAMAKDSAIIHMYTFCRIGNEKEVFADVAAEAMRHGADTSLLNTRVARPYSAMEEEAVLEFRVDRV
jgi:tRNA (guanine37-N1)-methyltransferase